MSSEAELRRRAELGTALDLRRIMDSVRADPRDDERTKEQMLDAAAYFAARMAEKFSGRAKELAWRAAGKPMIREFDDGTTVEVREGDPI